MATCHSFRCHLFTLKLQLLKKKFSQPTNPIFVGKKRGTKPFKMAPVNFTHFENLPYTRFENMPYSLWEHAIPTLKWWELWLSLWLEMHILWYCVSLFADQNPQACLYMLEQRFCYGCEFYGARPLIAVTPHIDRCFLTLAQAVEQCKGSMLTGATGVGKTETVKVGVTVHIAKANDLFFFS